MQRGEWWIDDDGNSEFADAEIGDWDHESFAFYRALGLSLPGDDMDWPEGLSEQFMCCEIERESDAKILLANGADPKAVAFFRSGRGTPDARLWACREMGWVRAVTTDSSASLEFWGMDDAKLKRIQRSDLWGDDDEDVGDVTVTLSNWANGWMGALPLKTLLNARDTAQFFWAASGEVAHEGGLDGTRRGRSAFAGLMGQRR